MSQMKDLKIAQDEILNRAEPLTHQELKELVLHYLERGKDNAISRIHLDLLCGVLKRDKDRQVRLTLRELIDDGHLIAWCPQGYFIATTQKERADEIARLDKLAKNLLYRISCFKRPNAGQMTMGL